MGLLVVGIVMVGLVVVEIVMPTWHHTTFYSGAMGIIYKNEEIVTK
jgi:hypothetical protein